MIQLLIADGMRFAGGLAFAVGGASIVDVGLVGVAVGLFDQRVTAVGAFEQTREQVDLTADGRGLGAFFEHPLYTLKVITVDDRLMCSLYPYPVDLIARADRLILVADLAVLALYHGADVHLILQGAPHGFVAPQLGIPDGARAIMTALLLFVGGGVRDVVFVEIPDDRADAAALEIQRKDRADSLCGDLVDDQLVAVGGVFFVAVFRERADEITAAALHIEGRPDAFGVGGDVVLVDHPAHGVVEEVDRYPLTSAGVDRVVDRDIPHAELRKDLADVPAALAGVAPEPRAVLDDHAVDPLRVDVRHHAREVGTVEARARPAVVDIVFAELDIRLCVHKAREELLLIYHGVRFGLVAVLL